MFLRELLTETLTRTGHGSTAVIGWGRGMGHKGHMYLASAVIHKAKEVGGDPYFVVSRTVGKDDPIYPEEKMDIYKKVFPDSSHIFQTATDEMPDLTRVLSNLNQQGYTNAIVVVGADQVNALGYVKNYNNTPDKTGKVHFKFDSLEVISRQQTAAPDAQEEGPRATPMRQVLLDPSKSEEEKFAVWRDAMNPEIDDAQVMDLMRKAEQRMKAIPSKKVKESLPNANPEDNLQASQIKDMLNRGMAKLNPREQFVVYNVAIKGQSFAKVALAIGKSKQMAYNIYYTAIDKLRNDRYKNQVRPTELMKNVDKTDLDLLEGVFMQKMKNNFGMDQSAYDTKNPGTSSDYVDSNITIQLLKNIDRHGGYPIQFKDGTELHISSSLSQKILFKIQDLLPKERHAIINHIIQSSDNFKSFAQGLSESKKKELSESTLTELAAFHGSFRPRIGKFKPFSHFGSEQAANDRLQFLTANDPRFKGQTTGYLYKLDLGINSPATVKDYPSLQDPSTGRMDKIIAWVNDLIKDPRVKSYVWNYKDPQGRPQQKTGVDRLKGIQYGAKTGHWREWESPAVFLGRFVQALRDMGIDGFVYKNQVEHKGELSYIAFDPDSVRVIGRAKPVNLVAAPAAASVKKKVKEDILDEVADQPYHYMLTKKLPDARQYMFQTDSGTKFQVFFSLLDSGSEKIADVGFADQTDKDNPTIGVTGKGDAFRVFSTVGAIVKEYVNSVKPDFLSFNGKTQDPGRIKLYDMIAKNITRYLKDYEQSSHAMPGATDEKGYMLQRITKPVDENNSPKEIVWKIANRYDYPIHIFKSPDYKSAEQYADQWVGMHYDELADKLGKNRQYFISKHKDDYYKDRATNIGEVSKVSLSSDPDNFGAWVRDGGTPEKTVVIPTSKIHVFEPDSKFDDPHHAKNLANIVKAIKAGKQLPPILVRRHGIDRFQVVDGHHRFMAYRMAGAKSIPARVVDPKNVKEL